MLRAIGWALCFVFSLSGCSETLSDWVRLSDTTARSASQGSISRQLALNDWQWQLSGTLNLSYDADLYDVDLFDTPQADIQALRERGVTVLCYFSAGTVEAWRSDAVLIPEEAQGNTLPDWPDERWLDTTRSEVRDVMTARMDLAVSKGCHGIEPDNLDGYDNDNGLSLTAGDALDYARFLAGEAHARGLIVAQKNVWDLAADLVSDFDLAVSESCFAQSACDSWAPYLEAGKPVLNAEYAQQWAEDAEARADLCARSARQGLLTLVLPTELDDRFRYSCQTP